MKKPPIFSFVIIFVLIAVLGLVGLLFVNKTEKTTSPALEYCETIGGTVLTKLDKYNNSHQTCLLHSHIITEGSDAIDNSYECGLEELYSGNCPEEEPAPDYSTPVLGTDNQTMNQQLKTKTDDILGKLKHTGYTHKDYIRNDGEGVSLTDCSGFVGHLLQEEFVGHYNIIPQNYSCTHPLAADYYDYFDGAPVDADTAICWQKIENVADAQPGDILVYKSTENISNDKKTCPNGDKVYKLTSDSGHVMVIHSHPKLSSCKDSNQYYVRVADSTASPHYHDTRAGDAPNNNFRLDYNSWFYEHTKDNGDKYYTHSGLGTGTLWLNKDIEFFRWKSCSGTKHHKDIIIGRPVACK
ncbi:hypothetical protein KJ918_00585 [Patescibacteria group bacterium]|nr:hypothetical protein [Patescibacteria group bacterium]